MDAAPDHSLDARGYQIVDERPGPAGPAYEQVEPHTRGRLRVLRVGDVELDLDGHQARVGRTPVHLSAKEFLVLHFLLDHVGRVVTRRELLDAGWGPDYIDPDTHKTIEVYIRRIRRRLGDHDRIRTVRGLGYIYDLPSPAP